MVCAREVARSDRNPGGGLAPSVSAEAVSASYDAGVLTVRVAGAYAEAEGHKIEISNGTSELVEGAVGQSQEG